MSDIFCFIIATIFDTYTIFIVPFKSPSVTFRKVYLFHIFVLELAISATIHLKHYTLSRQIISLFMVLLQQQFKERFFQTV
jgi:hypothetical protein